MPQREKLDYKKLSEGLEQLLLYTGPSTAKEICQRLNISQPTFSRLLSLFGERIFRAGRGPQIKYALGQLLPTGHAEIPVFAIKEDGANSKVAILHSIKPKGYYLESESATISSRFYPDMPYLFSDLRPSGFLGRLIPRLHNDLNLPNDIRDWNDKHCLIYLIHYGWDLVGNYIIGEQAFEKYIQNYYFDPPDVVEKNERVIHYPRIADKVMNEGTPGSSAAGEQPKFLAFRKEQQRTTPVLVKFSPPIIDAISQRIADLLVCEHIAHKVLQEHHQTSSKSCLISGGNRLFLETERFDRTPNKGRKGLITLDPLNMEFIGKENASWTEIAKELFSQKKIDAQSFKKVAWLETFGRLIANTDRHLGNVSFFIEGEKITGLAPAYDMLPMLYAPQQNQLLEKDFNPTPPKSSEFSVWAETLTAAQDFWKQVGLHPEISIEFKKLVAENESKLSEFKKLETLLPKNND